MMQVTKYLCIGIINIEIIIIVWITEICEMEEMEDRQ